MHRRRDEWRSQTSPSWRRRSSSWQSNLGGEKIQFNAQHGPVHVDIWIKLFHYTEDILLSHWRFIGYLWQNLAHVLISGARCHCSDIRVCCLPQYSCCREYENVHHRVATSWLKFFVPPIYQSNRKTSMISMGSHCMRFPGEQSRVGYTFTEIMRSSWTVHLRERCETFFETVLVFVTLRARHVPRSVMKTIMLFLPFQRYFRTICKVSVISGRVSNRPKLHIPWTALYRSARPVSRRTSTSGDCE